MRYRLRTLVILTAAMPPAIAAFWFWGLPALAFWVAPKTFGWALIIGIVNGTAFMLFGVLVQLWWVAYTGWRETHSK